MNGEVMQSSSTALMIFSVAELVSFCSSSFTLREGDTLLSGTPAGCGAFRNPKRLLAAGDVVECRIERIGALRNRLVDRWASGAAAPTTKPLVGYPFRCP